MANTLKHGIHESQNLIIGSHHLIIGNVENILANESHQKRIKK